MIRSSPTPQGDTTRPAQVLKVRSPFCQVVVPDVMEIELALEGVLVASSGGKPCCVVI